MALPTDAQINAHPTLRAAQAVGQAAAIALRYAEQAKQFLASGQMNSSRTNQYLFTLVKVREVLLANVPTPEVDALFQFLFPENRTSATEEHAALLADTERRIAEVDKFLGDAGLKIRELSTQEADALRAKLEPAGVSERVV